MSFEKRSNMKSLEIRRLEKRPLKWMPGPSEMMIIVVAVFFLFGAKKIPDMAKSMGSAMGEFRKAQKQSELNLRNFESEIKNMPQEEIRETKTQKIAKSLGISVDGKSEDQLLDEIELRTRIREDASP